LDGVPHGKFRRNDCHTYTHFTALIAGDELGMRFDKTQFPPMNPPEGGSDCDPKKLDATATKSLICAATWHLPAKATPLQSV
jgi:hypothetical protein